MISTLLRIVLQKFAETKFSKREFDVSAYERVTLETRPVYAGSSRGAEAGPARMDIDAFYHRKGKGKGKGRKGKGNGK